MSKLQDLARKENWALFQLLGAKSSLSHLSYTMHTSTGKYKLLCKAMNEAVAEIDLAISVIKDAQSERIK
jgi:hypothetical protein